MKKKAYFAGGCFWGLEYHIRKLDGVISVLPGYMGGDTRDPSYEEVCTGTTGHHEVVEVQYDNSKVSYEDLLKSFFELHDPTGSITTEEDQVPESVIFTSEAEEMEIANGLIAYLKTKEPVIITEIRPLSRFWTAEEEHQDYYNKNKKTPTCTARVSRFS